MISFKERLKHRLTQPLPGTEAQYRLAPKTRPVGNPDSATINAGVLILFYPDQNNELSIVLMKRPEYDGPHSAQVSFPGGKEEGSDKSIIETALRESFEEIGINISEVEILGKITPLYIPVSNFLVHPVVGITTNKPEFKIDKNEVEYIIECPVYQIMKANIKQTGLKIKGITYKVPYFDIKNEIVWGATSMIVSELIDILSELQPEK